MIKKNSHSVLQQIMHNNNGNNIIIIPSPTVISALLLLLLLLLVSGFATQAYANQLDVLLLPDEDNSGAEFTGVRFIRIEYPQGSWLASLLDDRNERIEFTVSRFTYNDGDDQGGRDNSSGASNEEGDNNNGSSNGMDKIVQAINSAFLNENNSPVIVENATLTYIATVKGYQDRAELAYRVEFKPNITRYVLQEWNSSHPAIIDLDWRDVVVKGSLPVTTEKYGTVNVNYPVGALEVLFPELAQKLLNSGAKEIMEDPLLNFSRFGLPMKSWHFLFDVTGKQLARFDVFREGEGATVSIYSIGESSFREGTYVPAEKDATVSIDRETDAVVKIHASTPPPSGQITIAGYSAVEEKGGTEFALVYSSGPGRPLIDIFGFQMQVLLVLGGIMGAVAVFALIKARR